MAINIIKAKPQAPSKFIVLGEPLSGKTTLAAKAPKPLFISYDGNAAKSGYDAVQPSTTGELLEAARAFVQSDYQTLVIDTVEGLNAIVESESIAEFNRRENENYASVSEVPYFRANGIVNQTIEKIASALMNIQGKNVIILSYTRTALDEATGHKVLQSELKKNIRYFTMFADAIFLVTHDGDRHEARLHEKRTTVGDPDLGDIETFLVAGGWELPKKPLKIGKK